MLRSSKGEKNPLILMLQKGLEFWVRRQCNGSGALKIDLNCTPIKLIHGYIDEVRLEIKNVNFQEIYIHNAQLSTSSFQFNLNLYSNEKIASIKNEFYVQADLILTSQDLQKTISSERWFFLNQLLAKNLLLRDSLISMKILDDILEATGKDNGNEYSAKCFYKLEVVSGKMIVKNENRSYEIPMDPSIYINHAILEDGKIFINLTAKVTP